MASRSRQASMVRVFFMATSNTCVRLSIIAPPPCALYVKSARFSFIVKTSFGLTSRRANEHSRVNPRGEAVSSRMAGACPGGNRRTHQQILAAAKRYCPSRTARVTEPSQLNICRSLSVFD
jgi:hypothetical protein